MLKIPKTPNPLVLQLAGLAVPLPFRRRKHIRVFWYKGQFHYIEYLGESQKGFANNWQVSINEDFIFSLRLIVALVNLGCLVLVNQTPSA